MRPIIETVEQLEEHSSWRKYVRGIRELELLEAPSSSIRDFRCQAAQSCFLAFVDILMKGELVVEPFHEIIGAAFEDLANLRYRRLILSCAPRSGKSLLAQHFAAWLYGRNQKISNIISSYGKDLSGVFERGIKKIMKNPMFTEVFPDFLGFDGKISQTLTGGGILHATSPGASLTGFAAGSLEASATSPGAMLVDDILKNGSQVAAAKALPGWWGEEASTRKTNQWIQCVIGTRWLMHDLHGIVLQNDGIYDPEENPLGWRYLNFEAICENPSSDPLMREKGESHWPSNPIFAIPMLLAQKKTMGKNRFAALYQGNPVPDEGSIFRPGYFILSDKKPDCDIIYFSIDCGLSEKQSADDSVITVLGLERPKLGESRNEYVWVLEQVSGPWAFPELLSNLQQMAKFYNPANLVIERAAAGISLIQVLKKEAKIHVDPEDGYVAARSKQIRLQQTLPLFENHRVKVVKDEFWNKKLRDQLVNFPFGEHDDCVDSLVWGLIYFQDKLDGFKDRLMEEVMKSQNWHQQRAEEGVNSRGIETSTSRRDSFWSDGHLWNRGHGSSRGSRDLF